MGRAAYGRLVAADADSARYEFAKIPGTWLGVVSIPLSDTSEWKAEGADPQPAAAGLVVMKALRILRKTGEWPEYVSFQS